MNSFVDLRKISSYSNALAEKLTSAWFSDKPTISGPEIKKFSEIEQVNLFILKNLFEKWQEETSRLRSPYFNYDTPEVQQAVKNLLNVLSNQIQVSKEFFKPLLTKAIEDCLTLASAPVTYFENQLSGSQLINSNEINQLQKFQKINLNYISFLNSLFEKSSTETLPISEIFAKLKQANIQPEDNSAIIDKLFSLLRIETKEIFLEPEINLQLPKQEEVSASAETFTNPESEQPMIKSTRKEIAWDRPIFKPENMENKAELSTESESNTEKATPSFLHSMVSGNKGEAPLFHQKITDLRTAIPLSDKFLFIRELFNDEPSGLAEALQGLEKCTNLNDAVNFLESNCLVKYKWTKDNSYLPQFMQLLEKRFS